MSETATLATLDLNSRLQALADEYRRHDIQPGEFTWASFKNEYRLNETSRNKVLRDWNARIERGEMRVRSNGAKRPMYFYSFVEE